MSSSEFLSQFLFTLISFALLLTIVGAVKRMLLWSQGQSSTIHWLGLIQIPRRYLVDLHHVVARDKYMSNTHVATAGGFVLSSILIILLYVFQLQLQILTWALLGSSLSLIHI